MSINELSEHRKKLDNNALDKEVYDDPLLNRIMENNETIDAYLKGIQDKIRPWNTY